MEMQTTLKGGLLPWKWLVIVVALLVLVGWLVFTPQGLLGKADAIGYAVCHRIDLRSFHIGDRPLPLCARCSGMYLGALVGIVYQFAQGRRMGMPGWKALAFFALLALAFAVDGSNSFLHLIDGAPSLYQPSNTLRLITGTGMGLAMAAVLAPTFNQTMWQAWDARPLLGSLKQIAGLLGLSALLVALVLTESPLVLYPLALLSSASVLVVLSLVYSMVVVMLFRGENRFARWRELWLPLTGGFILALLQLAGFDLVRYLLTGTWSGFNL